MRMIIDSVVGALSADTPVKQVMDFWVSWETAKRNVKIDYEYKFVVNLQDQLGIFGNVAFSRDVYCR